jgi:HD-like signal output (HDOD) protein
MNAATLELIKKSAAVPSIPQVVTRFLEIMQDPDFDYSDLAKVISTDPGTVSEILRLCNSALFGVRQKVVSLRQALTLLGPKRTRSLLLGRYLVDTLSHRPAAGLDMRYFWRRSLTTAVVGARFADRTMPQNREEVFVAALLSDIGIPILAEAMPEPYAPIAARHAPRGKPFTPDEERRAVQATHAEVSAMVLAHWTLPDPVCQAVNLHHSDRADDGAAVRMARLINGADRIARVLCEPPEDAAGIARTWQEATQVLETNVDTLLGMLPVIESDIHELGKVLRIDVLPGKVHAQIAKAVRDQLGAPV